MSSKKKTKVGVETRDEPVAKIEDKVSIKESPKIIHDFSQPTVAPVKVDPPPVKAPVTKPPEEPGMPFETYCRHKKISPKNWAGMRAYTKVTRASMKTWDAIFASY